MENFNKQKARDYDKDPIAIKDYAFYDYMKYSTIATLIGCLFFISVVTVVNPIEPKNFRLLPFALVMFFIRRKQQKGPISYLTIRILNITKKIKLINLLSLNKSAPLRSVLIRAGTGSRG